MKRENILITSICFDTPRVKRSYKFIFNLHAVIYKAYIEYVL